MSVGHSEASFNHSCLKVPVDFFSQKPSPKYERSSSAKFSEEKKIQGEKKEYPLCNLYNNFNSIKSYLEFYESIPDYSELHHLSNEEFYSRLRTLKITQKRFFSDSDVLDTIDVNSDTHHDITLGNNGSSFRTKNKKDEGKIKDRSESCFCCSLCFPDRDYCNAVNNFSEKIEPKISSATKQSPPKINIISDNENASDLFEQEFKKHSGYEADQESSTLQARNKSRNSYINTGDDFFSGGCSRSRSLPVTPACECQTPELCHRFSDVSFRNDTCHSCFGSSYCLDDKEKQSPNKKPKKSLSRPVPLTSRIPLFDKIMMEKEERRRIEHNRYSEELRSLVKPFSFTKREEEKERLRMICSNPELSSINSPFRFKAKPIPKNLFSDYAYERMKEDEFYRALKRRIRAEEMLKSSSLPPSMALREKKFRSKSLDFLDYRSPKKSWNKACGYRRACKNIRDEIEFDQKRKSDTAQKKRLKPNWASNKRRINSATDSSTEISPYESVLEPESRPKTRPHSALTASRNNLASVLRIETARKRLEKEMEEKLRENRLKSEAKFKARLLRMTPAWRALNYDKDEDLALRMAARREEDRQKQEKHQRLMESIYGRVYRMPPLFHNERFQSGKKYGKNSIQNKDSHNVFSCDDSVGNQKSEIFEDLPEEDKSPQTFDIEKSMEHKDNYASGEPSESTASYDKSEKAKAYESDGAT